jgi:hypothetical protein
MRNLPIDAKLLALAQRAAEAEGLDATLVCAVVEQASVAPTLFIFI